MNSEDFEAAVNALREKVTSHGERILILENDSKYTRRYLNHICKLLQQTDHRLTVDIKSSGEKISQDIDGLRHELKPIIQDYQERIGARKLASAAPAVLSFLISLAMVGGVIYTVSAKMTVIEQKIEQSK